jgi:hypothetical protein
VAGTRVQAALVVRGRGLPRARDVGRPWRFQSHLLRPIFVGSDRPASISTRNVERSTYYQASDCLTAFPFSIIAPDLAAVRNQFFLRDLNWLRIRSLSKLYRVSIFYSGV